MDKELLIARLKERLEATGNDPVPLAKKLGRGRDFLTDVLNGRKSTIPNDVLTPLARELRCDERYFTDELFALPGRPRRSATPQQLEEHAELAKRSGLFLKAWREFLNLSQQDLADETRLSLGAIHDIEAGNLNADASQISVLAQALGTSAGALQTQNPFESDRRIARLATITEELDLRDQEALLDMAEAFRRRAAS